MATDERHAKQVKSVIEGTRSISCTAIATEVGISPASVYRIRTNSLRKRKVCAMWIPHMLNDDQRAMCLLLANTRQQHRRNEGNAFLNRILTVDESWMHSFDPQLKQQNAEWRATSQRKKIARRSQGALKVTHVMFFSRNGLVLDHSVPVGTTVYGPYYCSLLQDKVRPALRHNQPELLERGAILFQNNATPNRNRNVQNLVQLWGWEVLAHPPYSPDLALYDYWLFSCVKEHLRGKRFQSEDNINTSVTASLERPSKDEYRAAIDCLPCR
jgi:histone-lysine N-methyltransferase SETMAR